MKNNNFQEFNLGGLVWVSYNEIQEFGIYMGKDFTDSNGVLQTLTKPYCRIFLQKTQKEITLFNHSIFPDWMAK